MASHHSAPGPGGKRRRGRAITKAERERAAAVHRSHVLCLAARALALDGAACSPEVQVRHSTHSLVPRTCKALRSTPAIRTGNEDVFVAHVLTPCPCSPGARPQATTLSLLPASAALRNVGCPEGAQRAINGLLPLAGWFRGAFAVLPPDVVAGRGREPLDLQVGAGWWVGGRCGLWERIGWLRRGWQIGSATGRLHADQACTCNT